MLTERQRDLFAMLKVFYDKYGWEDDIREKFIEARKEIEECEVKNESNISD